MDIQMIAEWNDTQADGTSTRYREGVLYRGVDDEVAQRAIAAGRALAAGGKIKLRGDRIVGDVMAQTRHEAVTLEAKSSDPDSQEHE